MAKLFYPLSFAVYNRDKMNANEFYQSRQSNWKALSDLLDRCQAGVSRLSPEEIARLGKLYRAAASELALAQRDFPGERVTAYLNQLVGRAHAVIYRNEPLAYRRLLLFATGGFARAFRELLPFTLAAGLMFVLPALMAALTTNWQPEAARWFLPPRSQSLIPLIEDHELWVNIPVSDRPYASSFVMRNNIQVAFLSFGGGMLAGLLTVWVMLSNGLTLGGITGLAIHHGIGFELWSFVIGHGVIELSVIIMAGGAGLRLGWAILHPGLLHRRDALAVAGRQAVRLLVGCVPLLMIAGIIEGFISPAETIAPTVKWAVGIGSGALLYSYLQLAGREQGVVLRQRSKAGSSLSTPGSD